MGMVLFAVILGHLVGDYLLQTTKEAENKFKDTLFGWQMCAKHCVVYTAAVLLSVYLLAPAFVTASFPLFAFLIFNSHFWIDKYSLGKWWMENIKRTRMDTTGSSAPFLPLVYVAVDNTMHFVLMTAIVKILS